ncbi:MAG: nicotinate-nucleotide adenylyltransferase [Paracoccaceae bacterium]
MIGRGPLAFPGQRIGLLGGSFDPPHAGHMHVTRRAMKAVNLDAVWWLVSPGNPLKANGPADIERRVRACRDLVDHPRVHVTDIERYFGSSYTANTLQRLSRRYSGVRFIWLMGADNLASFHHWEDWQWIIETYPICVLARPGDQVHAGLSPAAQRYAEIRVPASQAASLGRRKGAGWCLLAGPMSDTSSTRLRADGVWS